MSNPLEELLKDNWKSIQNVKTPMDQVMLSVDMVYQQAVLSDAMPPGNLTWIEFRQRESLRRLYNEIVEYRKNGGIWEKLKEIL